MDEQAPEKILLALDGSDGAFETVRYISMIPSFHSTELVLFSVFDKIPENYWDLESQANVARRIRDIHAREIEKEAALDKYMEQARDRLLKAGFLQNQITVKIRQRKKGIARDIIAEAKKGYDAVAIGRRGFSKMKYLVLGSVATKVLEKLSFIPLFVVGRCQKPEKVLLAVDGSTNSMRTVHYVASALSDCNCEVMLLHVVRSEEKNVVDEAKRRIRPFLDTAKGHLRNCGFAPGLVKSKIVTGVLSRAGAVLDEAKQGGFSTIVIGRRGMSNVRDFFMGRVSNKVVQLAKGTAVWVII
jgi:nucleotide-binding universal stress UspA family protein